MSLKLVSEEDMSVKSRKIVDTKKTDIVITKKPINIEKIGDDDIKKVDVDVDIDTNVDNKKPNVSPVVNPNIIVKRIYFPGDKYSEKKVQTEFKSILEKYGLSWYKPMMKSYTNKEGKSVLTGLYASVDQNKKAFCIYDGTNKPTTVIVKIMGSGGNFLIDLISFVNRVGCVIEDKDELFVNNMLLSLQEQGEIYVEKKVEMVKLEDYDKILEEKVKKLVDEYAQKYIDDYKETLEKRGVSLNVALFFKKKEIEEDIRWGLKKGFVKI